MSRIDWRRAADRRGLAIQDEAERLDRDAAAKWLEKRTAETKGKVLGSEKGTADTNRRGAK